MNLSPAETELLRRFRLAMTERFGPRLTRLVLFGSRARGEGHEESDLDVLVLVEAVTAEERRRVLDRAFELELETGLALSPLVRDAATFSSTTMLAREIARDGVAV
jgi:uncharacterized protein